MERLWPIMMPDDPGEAMMIAIANDRLDVVQALLARGLTGNTLAESVARGPGKITLFHFACERLNLAAAKLLFGTSIDLEAVEGNGMTALMSVCSAMRPDTDGDMKRIPRAPQHLERAEAMIKWLVASGADVNAIRPADSMTVLHWAAQGGSEQIVQFLLDRGARVDWPADDSQPALVVAARYANVGALRALVLGGADIHRACTLSWATGRTALGVAMMELDPDAPDERAQAAIAYLRSIGSTDWPNGASGPA